MLITGTGTGTFLNTIGKSNEDELVDGLEGRALVKLGAGSGAGAYGITYLFLEVGTPINLQDRSSNQGRRKYTIW